MRKIQVNLEGILFHPNELDLNSAEIETYVPFDVIILENNNYTID